MSLKLAKQIMVLTKMWNDLKRPETTYNEQEST